MAPRRHQRPGTRWRRRGSTGAPPEPVVLADEFPGLASLEQVRQRTRLQARRQQPGGRLGRAWRQRRAGGSRTHGVAPFAQRALCRSEHSGAHDRVASRHPRRCPATRTSDPAPRGPRPRRNGTGPRAGTGCRRRRGRPGSSPPPPAVGRVAVPEASPRSASSFAARPASAIVVFVGILDVGETLAGQPASLGVTGRHRQRQAAQQRPELLPAVGVGAEVRAQRRPGLFCQRAQPLGRSQPGRWGVEPFGDSSPTIWQARVSRSMRRTGHATARAASRMRSWDSPHHGAGSAPPARARASSWNGDCCDRKSMTSGVDSAPFAPAACRWAICSARRCGLPLRPRRGPCSCRNAASSTTYRQGIDPGSVLARTRRARQGKRQRIAASSPPTESRGPARPGHLRPRCGDRLAPGCGRHRLTQRHHNCHGASALVTSAGSKLPSSPSPCLRASLNAQILPPSSTAPPRVQRCSAGRRGLRWGARSSPRPDRAASRRRSRKCTRPSPSPRRRPGQTRPLRTRRRARTTRRPGRGRRTPRTQSRRRADGNRPSRTPPAGAVDQVERHHAGDLQPPPHRWLGAVEVHLHDVHCGRCLLGQHGQFLPGDALAAHERLVGELLC